MTGILFCTPCYGGQVTQPMAQSWNNLTFQLTQLGIEHDWLTRGNESLVHRGRMGITKEFLESNFSHMMWIDADIEFSPDDVAKLWNLKEDIAVGVYRMKTKAHKWSAWVNGKLVDLEQLDGPTEVDYAGTGFMMLSRDVILDVWAHLRDRQTQYLELVEKHIPKGHQGWMRQFAPWASYENEKKAIPALYMTPIHDGILESEDYHFCRMAREAGHKIVMDPSVKLTHWGTYGYGAE